MGKASLIKYGWAALQSNQDILKSLRLMREYARRINKSKKTQTATNKTNLIYGRKDKPGTQIMSHGRMRSLPLIKELQRRRGLHGRKLRLSDYKQGVKAVPSTEMVVKRLNTAKRKNALKNYNLWSGDVRIITKKSWGQKIDAAEKRLREVLGGKNPRATSSYNYNKKPKQYN